METDQPTKKFVQTTTVPHSPAGQTRTQPLSIKLITSAKIDDRPAKLKIICIQHPQLKIRPTMNYLILYSHSTKTKLSY